MGSDPEVVDRDLEALEEEEPRGRALLLRRSEADRADAASWSSSWWRRSTSCCRRSSASRTRSAKLGDANPIWIAVALAFNVLAFFSYVALFRGVVGERVLHLEWRESYQITMAGLAATRLFSAGGAGGIVLTYWALRKAGMPRAPDGLPDGGLPGPAVRRLHGRPGASSGSCCAPASSTAPTRPA